MKVQSNFSNPLIIALDTNTLEQAEFFVEETRSYCQIYKVGLELFTACGPKAIEMIHQKGAQVFLDLKLHDIPHTVGSAIKAAHQLGVRFLTVHAMGGPSMLAEAARTQSALKNPPELLAVSVLTHHSETELHTMGFQASVRDLVCDRLQMAYDAGLRGCVCSPQEAPWVRAKWPTGFTMVCPGIRPLESDQNDQTRIATPFSAVLQGADYLVVGRPIVQSKHPKKAAEQIAHEIQEGLHARAQAQSV